MKRKRLILVIIAAILFLSLSSTGILLLAHKESYQTTGNLNGTIGASNVIKPDNLEDLEFGISISTYLGAGSGSLSTAIVKNGNTVTISDRTDIEDYAIIVITRHTATSDFLPDAGTSEVVYEEKIPLTLYWDRADILSTANWSDDYFDDEDFTDIETTYSVMYSESCLGNFYTSQINVTYKDSYGDTRYCMYGVCLGISVKQ